MTEKKNEREMIENWWFCGCRSLSITDFISKSNSPHVVCVATSTARWRRGSVLGS